MEEKKSKKIKDLTGAGVKSFKAGGNRVTPSNDFIPFNKEEIHHSIPERFEAIVEKYPDQIAVKTGGRSVTYDVLNKKANRAAHCILNSYDDRYALSEDEKRRYGRQLKLHDWGIEAQEKLKSATVFAAGAGGSGSPLIQQLALCGVGIIIICDYDTVELSNLNRQVLHDESRIGMNKALSAQMTVNRINPHVRVIAYTEKITADNVYRLVGDAAIIFDNVDDIETKFVLSQCAVHNNIPHILSSMIDMDAYAAIFLPPYGPCFHCLYDRNIINEIEEIRKIRDERDKNYEKFSNPVASPALFLAAGFAANEALKIILGIGKPSYNKFFLFDQRGVKSIIDTMGYKQITYPFSRHFKETCKKQGFDWDEGPLRPRDGIVKELTVEPDPQCPLCKENGHGQERIVVEKRPVPAVEAVEEKHRRAAALLFEHGMDMIAGIMGVLKTCMLYVPLDASYPVDRLSYILEDSDVRVIITNHENIQLAETLRNYVNKNIAIVNINEIPANASTDNPRISIDPGDLAYILYTSGSTGKPKGVMQNHCNVLHHARVYTNALHIHAGDKLTLFSSYSFDAAKMDIYGALLNGAVLYPYNIKQEDHLQQMPFWLRVEGITIYHSIPMVYRYFTGLLEEMETGGFPRLRMIVLGGEAVFTKDVDHYKKYFSGHCLFVNGLGPTESTVALQYFIDKETGITRESVPVGYPVEDTEVILLTEHNQEAGVLGVGEIVFKSEHLALGYWKNPELTAEKFCIDKSFSGGAGGRFFKKAPLLYKTGDLGRRLPDGAIEFVGRSDFQVKIRGYRVEPGEIESKLDLVNGIKKSVVVCRQDNNSENFLAAYYTVTGEKEIDDNYLITILKETLPDYMIPTVFFSLPEFPLLATGKIDRKTLAQQDIAHLIRRGELEAPANETEIRLLSLWKEVLKRDTIGVNENFFVLGGNSIKAILLVSRISKELNVKISLVEIFKRPFIKELAKYVANEKKYIYQEIIPVEKRDYYPLSSAQQRLFFSSRFENGGIRFNIPVALRVRGPLDIQRYKSIIDALIQRHETLRTSFHLLDDQPVQWIQDIVEFEIERLVVSRGDLVWSPILMNFIRPFDLAKAPLFRVGLFSVSGDEHYLLCDVHHIIFDGTSMDILVQDFTLLYRKETVIPLNIQYKDFVMWQNNLFQSGLIKKEEEHWLNLYSDVIVGEGEIPRINLPTDYPRPREMSYEGDNYRFSLDSDISRRLKEMAAAENVSLFMLVLAMYNVFLSKLSGQDDIISAVVTAGRNHPDAEKVIGVFINMLALRNQPGKEKSFAVFLEEVKQTTMAAFENQDYPFEILVEKLPGSREADRHPLMDVGFTLQNTGMGMEQSYRDETSELQLVSLKSERKSARNDLNLEGFDILDRLELEFQYRTKLFKKQTVISFARYFESLITRVLENPGRQIGDIELLTEAEREFLLVELNDTRKKYPEDKTVFQLLEEQVARVPGKIAVRSTIELQNIYDQLKPEDIEVELSYEELNERANQLAHQLREKGVGPDSIVGLMVQHPLKKVIGIWGIMKSGGAYLPIDPLYPPSVIKDIFSDSRALLTVSETAFAESLAGINTDMSIIFIDDIDEENSLENPQPVNCMSHLAYIIYTSGTTGKAKGTAVEHKGIANYARWRVEYFNFTGEDVTLQPLTYSFDSFCANFYPSFLCGGELVMVPDNRRLAFDYIVTLIREYRVTTICFAPGLYNVLLGEAREGDLESLRLVVLAGEASGPALIKESREKAPHIRLANEYGPSEASVAATCYPKIQETSTSIVGQPLANVAVYILDDTLKPVLPGAVGEICIGGTGVARGYLNKPELTAEKFITKSFCGGGRGAVFSKKAPLLYKTGDLGRWLLNENKTGNIEFLGRKDHQVKIRGHRIELEQVEALLGKHQAIKEVLVDVKGKEDNRYICAYVVPRDPGSFYPAAIKEYLEVRLPYYMVPSHIVPLETFPLTPNGKINRKALPNQELTGASQYMAPQNKTEEQLVQLWSEVLNLEPGAIGIDANFFDLGGHSLRATMLVSRIQKEMDVNVQFTDFFESPTIRGLARLLQTRPVVPAREFSIEPAARKEYYFVSSTQKRLYLLQQMDPGNTGYNNIQPVLLEGTPDKEKLTAAFKMLIKRHESLRTSFEMIKGEPVQRVHKDVPFTIDYFEPRDYYHGPGSLEIEALIRDFRKPFDLARAPLFRVRLGQLQEKEFLLLLEIHHIIADIISFGIFVRDFTTLYSDGQLPQLKLHYKDFSEWENSAEGMEELKKQETFWLKEFHKEIPPLNLPLDFPRPEKRHFEGHSLSFTLASEECGALKKLARGEGVTLFMLILAIFNVFLAKISGQEEIIVGAPIAARIHPDLNQIIGMFANTLALLNCPMAEKTFPEFLADVKKRTLEAFENQEFPFEQLVNQAAIHREPGRNPLFDVMFNFRGADTIDETPAAAISGIKLTLQAFESDKSKFDMTLYVQDNGDVLHFIFAYSTQLFKKETIETFAGYFKRIVTGVLENSGQKIADIEIMTREKIEKMGALFSEALEDE